MKSRRVEATPVAMAGLPGGSRKLQAAVSGIPVRKRRPLAPVQQHSGRKQARDGPTAPAESAIFCTPHHHPPERLAKTQPPPTHLKLRTAQRHLNLSPTSTPNVVSSISKQSVKVCPALTTPSIRKPLPKPHPFSMASKCSKPCAHLLSVTPKFTQNVRQQNIDADALLERLDQYTLSRYSSTARKRPPLHDIILAKQSSEQDTVKMKLKLSEESQSEAETRERRNSVWPMTNFYEIEEELVEITWDHWQIDTDPKARCIQPLAITHQQWYFVPVEVTENRPPTLKHHVHRHTVSKS